MTSHAECRRAFCVVRAYTLPRSAHAATKARKLQKTPVISIVDDDESVRVATQNLIRSLGLAAHTFASAKEFLCSPLIETSSCINYDVQMPTMDGLELQSELLARGNRVPIIFITAFPNPKTETLAKNAGAICVLHKPFDCDTLIGYLDAALRRNAAKPSAD
jgi:FixJ family two-component response regulator